MRLYKWISPVIVIVLLFGVTLNSDSFTVENSGGNYYMNSAIDKQYELAFSSNEEEKTEDIIDMNSDSYKIVKTAFKELGEAGGKKYWSYFGFNSWSAWCCTFVSWCAEQCGYIDSGLIPKFTSVSEGLRQFKKEVSGHLEMKSQPLA